MIDKKDIEINDKIEKIKGIQSDSSGILKMHERILVFVMAKVGSMSVYESLYESGFANVYHFHEAGFKPKSDKYYDNIIHGWYCSGYNFFRNSKIISIVREPVSRAISGFFFNMNKDHKNYFENRNIGQITEEIGIERRVFHGAHWFDNNFKPVTGFDIYENAFDKEKGYTIYRSRNIEILLFKLEISNDMKEKAIKEFLDIESFTLKSVNVGTKRKYGKIYSEFLKTCKIKGELLERAYNVDYVKHFYTDDEIAQFYERWVK